MREGHEILFYNLRIIFPFGFSRVQRKGDAYRCLKHVYLDSYVFFFNGNQ